MSKSLLAAGVFVKSGRSVRQTGCHLPSLSAAISVMPAAWFASLVSTTPILPLATRSSPGFSLIFHSAEAGAARRSAMALSRSNGSRRVMWAARRRAVIDASFLTGKQRRSVDDERKCEDRTREQDSGLHRTWVGGHDPLGREKLLRLSSVTLSGDGALGNITDPPPHVGNPHDPGARFRSRPLRCGSGRSGRASWTTVPRR